MADMDRTEHGSALLVTLLTAMLLAGLAGGLVIALMTEEAVEANHRRAVVALYAADGMLTRAISELARLPDWQPVLDGTYVSSLRVGTATRRLADGSSVNLFVVTDTLQRELDEMADLAVVEHARMPPVIGQIVLHGAATLDRQNRQLLVADRHGANVARTLVGLDQVG